MEKYFLPYELALELKGLGFNKLCIKGFYEKEPIHTIVTTPVDFNNKRQLGELISAPLYFQVIDWFEKEHNIFIGRTCYDDGKTSKRWVYHVDDYYVQEQSYDGAIKYAIDKIKNKVR